MSHHNLQRVQPSDTSGLEAPVPNVTTPRMQMQTNERIMQDQSQFNLRLKPRSIQRHLFLQMQQQQTRAAAVPPNMTQSTGADLGISRYIRSQHANINLHNVRQVRHIMLQHIPVSGTAPVPMMTPGTGAILRAGVGMNLPVHNQQSLRIVPIPQNAVRYYIPAMSISGVPVQNAPEINPTLEDKQSDHSTSSRTMSGQVIQQQVLLQNMTRTEATTTTTTMHPMERMETNTEYRMAMQNEAQNFQQVQTNTEIHQLNHNQPSVSISQKYIQQQSLLLQHMQRTTELNVPHRGNARRGKRRSSEILRNVDRQHVQRLLISSMQGTGSSVPISNVPVQTTHSCLDVRQLHQSVPGVRINPPQSTQQVPVTEPNVAQSMTNVGAVAPIPNLHSSNRMNQQNRQQLSLSNLPSKLSGNKMPRIETNADDRLSNINQILLKTGTTQKAVTETVPTTHNVEMRVINQTDQSQLSQPLSMSSGQNDVQRSSPLLDTGIAVPSRISIVGTNDSSKTINQNQQSSSLRMSQQTAFQYLMTKKLDAGVGAPNITGNLQQSNGTGGDLNQSHPSPQMNQQYLQHHFLMPKLPNSSTVGPQVTRKMESDLYGNESNRSQLPVRRHSEVVQQTRMILPDNKGTEPIVKPSPGGGSSRVGGSIGAKGRKRKTDADPNSVNDQQRHLSKGKSNLGPFKLVDYSTFFFDAIGIDMKHATPIQLLISRELLWASNVSVFKKGVKITMDYAQTHLLTGVYVFDVLVFEKDNCSEFPAIKLQVTSEYPAECPVILDFQDIANSISNKKARLRFEVAVKYFKKRISSSEKCHTTIYALVFTWCRALQEMTSIPQTLFNANANAKKKDTLFKQNDSHFWDQFLP